jgi:hypothetical protein
LTLLWRAAEDGDMTMGLIETRTMIAAAGTVLTGAIQGFDGEAMAGQLKGA